jgi:hypothetical protein
VKTRHISADSLITALAALTIQSTTPSLDVATWASDIMSHLSEPVNVRVGNGVLEDIIIRCQGLAQQNAGFTFVSITTYMQLAIKCQRCVSLTLVLPTCYNIRTAC